MADPLGGCLVNGDAGLEVGAVRLAWMTARQKARHGAGVITTTVAECPRGVQGQAAQDE